jgi:hypothetical protein
MATFELDDVVAARELDNKRPHGLDIVGMEDVYKAPSQKLLLRVPEHAGKRRICHLHVPVESRDAERIRRRIEEPPELVADSLTPLTHARSVDPRCA